MMKTLGLALLLAFTFMLGGCVLRPAHHHHGHKNQGSQARRPSCHPSQYWDGETCRHKGKGRGARKHDG